MSRFGGIPLNTSRFGGIPVVDDLEDDVNVLFDIESGYRDYDDQGNPITSPKGAMFKSQVTPATAADPGFGITPASEQTPEEFNRVGRDYYAKMLERYDGDKNKAVAAYNAGPTAVDRALTQGDNWLAALPEETQNHVRKFNERLSATQPDEESPGQPPRYPKSQGGVVDEVEQEKEFTDRLSDAFGKSYDHTLGFLATTRDIMSGDDDAAAEAIAMALNASDESKTPGRKKLDNAIEALNNVDRWSEFSEQLQGFIGKIPEVFPGHRAASRVVYELFRSSPEIGELAATAATNPAETAIMSAESAATTGAVLTGGGAGSVAGAAVGGVIGGAMGKSPSAAAAGARLGGSIGGRGGVASATAAVEVGAEMQSLVGEELASRNLKPTVENVKAVLADQEFKSKAVQLAATKGLTLAAVDAVLMRASGAVGAAPYVKMADTGVAATLGDKAKAFGKSTAIELASEPGSELASQGAQQVIDPTREIDRGAVAAEAIAALPTSAVMAGGSTALELLAQSARDTSPGAQLGRMLDAGVEGSQFTKSSEQVAAERFAAGTRATGGLEINTSTPADIVRSGGAVEPEKDVTGVIASQMQPSAAEATVKWLSEDGIEYPVQIVRQDVPVEGDDRPHALVNYNGVEALVPSEQLSGVTAAPPRSVSFTPDDSPTREAGLQPIIIPEVTNVSTPVTPVVGSEGSSQLRSTVSLGGMGDSGSNNVVGGDLGDVPGVNATPGRQTSLVPGGAVQSAPSVVEWTGNRGAGYDTIEAANKGLARRQELQPEYSWTVEPTGDKFKLVGTTAPQSNYETALIEADEADRGNNLEQMFKASTKLSNAFDQSVQNAIDVDGIAVFQSKKGDLTYAVHPSTRSPGKLQVTTYNATGALGDSTVNSASEVSQATGTHRVNFLSRDDAERVLNAVGAAEFDYQNRRPATEGVMKDGQVTPALPDSSVEGVGSQTERFRQVGQQAIDADAARRGEASPFQLTPAAPQVDQKVTQIGAALSDALGLKIPVVAFDSADPKSPHGFAVAGTAFVNVNGAVHPTPNTTLHEMKHVIEGIAQVENQMGLENTAAQNFTRQIDSLFDEMSEEGKRSYLSNLLHTEELRALDDTARESRIQELLVDKTGTLRSEMIADFLGNRATDRQFWRDLANQDPEGFQGFVQKWLDILDNLIDMLRGRKTANKQESSEVDNYVKDLNKAKMVVRDAMVEFRRRAKEEYPDQVMDTYRGILADRADSKRQDAPTTYTPRNLYVAHNLTEENLLHVSELGGLAAPSLAVMRTEYDFTSFGEITLLADPSILESSKTRVFESDVYTPRHPRATYIIDQKAYQQFIDSLGDTYGLRVPAASELSDRGASEMLYSDAVKMGYLRSVGKNIAGARNTDVYDMRRKIAKHFRTDKAQRAYESWARSAFESMVKDVKLFKGYTNSGNRRYIDYTLDNVVREMTAKVQGGEGFNYGAGSIRSRYSTQLNGVKGVQKARDKIISDTDFQVLKDESQDRLVQLLDDLRPAYKFDATGWGYMDNASSAIAEGSRGWREAFNLDDDVTGKIKDFIEYLTGMPTSYFEAKVGRAVDLSEFKAAVIPTGTSKDAVTLLKDKGLKVVTYKRGDNASRRDAITKQDKVLFSKRQSPAEEYRGENRPVADARGAARLHDLESAFGDDIYSENALQYFGSGDSREKDVVRILNNVKGDPDAEVTIYRGVPGNVDTINNGDWVTLIESVAQDYADLMDDGKVIEKTVKAGDVTSWADGLLEFGYFPQEVVQYSKRQTETPEFKKWFGDSKVVDENGEPLVVYRGLGEEYVAEKSPNITWVTPDPAYAGDYADRNSTTVYDTDGRFYPSGATILPLYAKAETPFDLGFRSTMTDVKYSDVMERVYGGVVKSFEMGRITRDEGVRLIGKIDKIQEKDDGTFKKVHSWWNSKPEIKDILQEAGYDSIHSNEGFDDRTPAYGLFNPSQIKSATGNRGTFDAGNPDIRFSKKQPLGFYSELSSQAAKGPGSAMKDQWKGYINGLKNKGVKPDEIEWSGVNDWLDMQTGKVSRDDVLNFLDNNGVQVEEVTLGGKDKNLTIDEANRVIANGGKVYAVERRDENQVAGAMLSTNPPQLLPYIVSNPDRYFLRKGDPDDAIRRKIDTKYAQYQLPGGDNYRGVLLTLPEKRQPFTPLKDLPEGFELVVDRSRADGRIYGVTPRGQFHARPYNGYHASADAAKQSALNYLNSQREMAAEDDFKGYKSAHWDQPNVIAHIRMNDRVDADGNRVLFIEELQSDFGQSTRKEKLKMIRAIKEDFDAIVNRMKSAGVLEVNCD